MVKDIRRFSTTTEILCTTIRLSSLWKTLKSDDCCYLAATMPTQLKCSKNVECDTRNRSTIFQDDVPHTYISTTITRVYQRTILVETQCVDIRRVLVKFLKHLQHRQCTITDTNTRQQHPLQMHKQHN